MRGAEYSDLFATLGVPPESAVQLKAKQANIYGTKIAAAQAEGELASSVEEYKRQIKEVLGDKHRTYQA